LVYLGEYETDAKTRPLSKMVVKQTFGDTWAYCFGTESLQTCLDVGPALGPYANAPATGEKVNLVLNSKKMIRFKDDEGKEMLGYPIYSSKVIEVGRPLLWQYVPHAGSGKNFL
jgi:hypothetical protein